MRITPFLLATVLLLLTALTATGEPEVNRVDLRVLLIGNSHSSKNDLPEMLEAMLEAGGASATAHAVRYWGFLAEHLEDGRTQEALDSERWTHVVLQAQKYSTTGRFSYPTDAAEEWIRRARRIDAVPILFPEWARRGHPDEGARIYTLHTYIASREPACVAPVPIAWEIVRDRAPRLRLHAGDGNHSNKSGAFLTALVLYEVISGAAATNLPALPDTGIEADTQAMLRDAASAALEVRPACNP